MGEYCVCVQFGDQTSEVVLTASAPTHLEGLFGVDGSAEEDIVVDVDVRFLRVHRVHRPFAA